MAIFGWEAIHGPSKTALSSTPTPSAVATIDNHAIAVPTPSALPLPNATAISTPYGAVATLSIPRIGIQNAPIYDRGTTSKGVMLIAAGYAATHYEFSAPFGAGNAVIYGHDDIQGNIFGHLYDLAPGDLIQITSGGQTQTYQVSGHQIVPPTDVGILAPTGDVRLTVITCWPFDVDTKRWIVTAYRVSNHPPGSTGGA